MLPFLAWPLLLQLFNVVIVPMDMHSKLNNYSRNALIALALMAIALPYAVADDQAASEKGVKSRPAKTRLKLDFSGRKQVGEASIYADKFANRKMADGNRMDPNDDNAASKTLPLGTKAKVTNLETGESTHVTIQDRGPFVKGRIIDLPPGKAEEIGLTLEEGVADVKVEPVTVPLPDGGVKRGEGAN